VKLLGFPLRLPVHKEDLSEEEAKEIISKFPEDVEGALITYSDTALEVIELCRYLNVRFLQLHGTISVDELQKIRAQNHTLQIIKSLVIGKDNTDKILQQLTPYVDYFITDTYDPTTGASGATGKTHNWEISRAIVQTSTKPVILAGGINAENVYEAIKFVKPFGVDSHTGIEDKSGRKSEELVSKFMQNAYKAFEEIKII